jgi:adenylate cyclase class 2
MREIEVKAKLTNKEAVVNKLKSLGCIFGESKTQNDVIYVEKWGDLNTFLSNNVFLRIRESKGKILFTLKTKGENSLSKIEHEVEVSSKEEIENILKLLKFVPAVSVNKTRSITYYNNFEICVDNVEDLGDFIEVERMVDEGEAKLIQDEMFTFLESFGVKSEDRVFEGYDILKLKLKDA